MPDLTVKNYRERLWNAVERVILPHIRLEERDGVRKAVREFESKEGNYFLKDDGPRAGVPMALTEGAQGVLRSIIALPGMKQILGPYGQAIESAVRGWPVAFDPMSVAFPRDITPIPPEEAPAKTIERYLSVAPAFRTHFTNDIIKIVQQMERIKGMTLQAFQLARVYLTSPEFADRLYQSYFDLRDLLYEHGAMLTALHNYVKRSFFAGDDKIRIYRVHTNMTALNERDDNNKLGNLFIEMTHLALQSRFETVHTVKSPEHTAFMFAGPSISQAAGIMSGIEQEIRLLMKDALAALPEATPKDLAEKERLTAAFADFKPRVVASQRVLSTENLLQYAIRSKEDALLFKDFLHHAMGIKPAVVEDSSLDDVFKLFIQGRADFQKIVARVNAHPELMKTTYALITKGLLEMIADLCAQTNFFEKEDKSGRILFDEGDLPKQGDTKFNVWRRYQKGKYGFVGPGIYDPASHGVNAPDDSELPIFSDVGFTDETELEKRIAAFRPDPLLSEGVNTINRVFPPFNRIAGHVSHRAVKGNTESGGVIEALLDAINALAAETPPPHIPIFPTSLDILEARLKTLKRRAHEASIAFRNLYRWAVTEQRHKLLPRVYERFPVRRGRNYEYVPADFVLQEIALQSVYALRRGAKVLFMIAEEYDSARARNDALAARGIERLDIDDGVFSSALNPTWQLASENGLPLPVVRREGGDHLTTSFTNVQKDGTAIDPYSGFALKKQEAVRRDNITFKFQEYTKVDIQIFRLTGKGLGEVVRPEFMEEMRQDMNLSAQPQLIFCEGERHDIGVEFADREGMAVTAEAVRNYLVSRGIAVDGAIKIGEDMKRMLTWKSEGGLVYGAFKSDGFEPFERTFTVTLVLGEFPPVIYAGDEALFHETEKYLNLAMGEVKRASLPNKEGRADLRLSSPMHKGGPKEPTGSGSTSGSSSGSSSGGAGAAETTTEFVTIAGYEGDQEAEGLSPAVRAQLLQASGAPAFVTGAAVYTGALSAATAPVFTQSPIVP